MAALAGDSTSLDESLDENLDDDEGLDENLDDESPLSHQHLNASLWT